LRKLTFGNIGLSGNRGLKPEPDIAGVAPWCKAITAVWVVRLAAAF